MEEQCKSLKLMAAEMLACRQRKGSPEELHKLFTKGLLHLTLLKAANRTVCEETEQVREATAEAKAQFDNAELALQNLLYEKAYYLKEIRACRSFRSKYTEEDIGLMPKNEFFSTAPEQFTAAFKGEEASEDGHLLMLARLDHEAHERAEALKRLEALRSRRDALAATVAGKRAFLQALHDQLQAIRSTAEPVRAKFGIKALQRPPGQLRAAALLPLPLHVAYTQLAAASEAFELGAEVTILGSLEEAQALAGGEASVQLMDIDEPAAEGGSVDEEEGEDEAELEPGEHRPTARRRSVADLSEAGQRAHPLAVHVSMPSEAGGGQVQLHLRYTPTLRLVTACAGEPADDVALRRLFEGDSGLTVPSEAAHLAAGGELVWDPARPDRPYRWAQDLAGLDALPPLDASGLRAAGGPEEAPALAQGLPELRRKAKASTVLEKLRMLRTPA